MNLIKTVETRTYELTYLVPTTYTDSEAAKIKDEFVSSIAKLKGTVISADSWGKKAMAYKIRHKGKAHSEAYYTHIIFSMDPAQTPVFENQVKLHADIMRHLCVKAEEKAVEEKKVEVKKA